MYMHILMPHIDEYSKNNFPLLRSKVLELHPVHRASLDALLRHLLHVSSHSDKNGMTVKELSTWLCHYHQEKASALMNDNLSLNYR
jgi:hypothetical protein